MKIIDIDELDDLENTETENETENQKKNGTNVKKIKKKKNTEENPIREFLNLVISVLIIVCLTLCIIRYVGQRTEVNGSSMEFTLMDKDNLIVDKITYRFSDPKRFDIIVFPYTSLSNPDAEPTYYIKRIIGLPGEIVLIQDGIIYINGEELKESYGKEVIQDAKRAAKPIQLGDDEYFVLGDNRNHSADSREIGNIKRDQIVGRAWLRIWPFDRIGILKHQ